MKKTKCVKLSRILILLSALFFLAGIIVQCIKINPILYTSLYIFAFLIMIIGWILAYAITIKDKEHMKNIELAKKDERLNNITVLSKAKAFDIFTVVFAGATVFIALNNIVDYKVMIILGTLNLFLLSSQVYYFIKFSKKM